MLAQQTFEAYGAHLREAPDLRLRREITYLSDGTVKAFSLTTQPLYDLTHPEVTVLRAEAAVQRNEGVRKAFSVFGALCIMGALLLCLPVIGLFFLVAEGARRFAW